MLLDRLLEIVPPPATPLDPGTTAAWGSVHRRLGTELPEDYIQFIKHYGTGLLGCWLRVLNPFDTSRHQNLMVDGFEMLAGLREFKALFPEEVPFPLFYEPDGLFPWGSSIDGDQFFWQTRGVSGHWTVVVICRHAPVTPEQHPLAFSQFLHAALMREIDSVASRQKMPKRFFTDEEEAIKFLNAEGESQP